MSTVKTAISLEGTLFERVDALARRLGISRSQVFVLAAEEFLRQHENRQLLEQINRAYSDEPDPSEQEYLERMKHHYRQLVEGEW